LCGWAGKPTADGAGLDGSTRTASASSPVSTTPVTRSERPKARRRCA